MSAVVQVIVVLSKVTTKHSLSSIKTVGVLVKPDPVNTTVFPPCSAPYLGVITSRYGVTLSLYSTAVKSDSTPPIVILPVQEVEVFVSLKTSKPISLISPKRQEPFSSPKNLIVL